MVLPGMKKKEPVEVKQKPEPIEADDIPEPSDVETEETPETEGEETEELVTSEQVLLDHERRLQAVEAAFFRLKSSL